MNNTITTADLHNAAEEMSNWQHSLTLVEADYSYHNSLTQHSIQDRVGRTILHAKTKRELYAQANAWTNALKTVSRAR